MKAISLLTIATFTLFSSCSQTGNKLTEIGPIGPEEVSGLEYISRSNGLWAVQDSGNESKVYNISNKGEVIGEVNVGITNHDWEDLTSDAEGNLYIGDFGNNDNKRKDLAIYKLSPDFETAVSTISFYYPEQDKFPPKKSQFKYDCEAFFEHNGNFYLFTKNRSARFDGSLFVYKVPNKEGKHAAKLIGTMKTCSAYRKCTVTSADISPDGTKVVLLTGDKIFVLTDFGADNFAEANMQMLELGYNTQKESICFMDNDTLFIADEKDDDEGGKLYQVKLSELQAEL